ncbi:GH14548 [Drosophila grimshawi]|uniref:GH14548 n=1 Tax=Drosophila grimshawi TaxID=7222 RepID=B4IYZ8_DROGR|nr:GH14548 [Drosophila grimshawi]
MRNTTENCFVRSTSSCNTSENYCSCQRLHETNRKTTHNIRSNILAESITFLHLCVLLLLCLSSTLAAPQSSCILCDKEDLRSREQPTISDSYEEFTFDHQVTRQDAIQALRKYNETLGGAQNSCNSMQCTATVMKYCLGLQFLNDHCWCELQHREEGLPYVPHICYVGEKVYKPSVGSCFFFEEVKECCCASALVRECKCD